VSASPDRAAARRPSALLGSSALLALGLAVGQVLGYAVNVVGARVLGPVAFGELGALLNILLIGNVVSLAVQAVVARRVARGGDRAALGRVALAAAAAETVLALVLVPVLAVVLHLGPVPLVALALAFLPLALTGFALGGAQGDERFGALSLQYAVAAALRSGLALVALVATRSVTATALAVLLGSVLGWFAVRPLGAVPTPTRGTVDRAIASETGRAALALLAMFTLTSVDVLLARALLSPEDAGQYAAGAILAKIAFWLPQAVVVAVFPRLANAEAGALRRALLLLVGLGALEVAAAAVAGTWAVPLLLGDGYAVVAASAAVFVLAGAVLSVAYLVLYDRLAEDDPRAAVLVWGAVAVLVVLVVTVGRTSPVSVAWCVVASGTLLTLAGTALRSRREGGS
jgi:O-antigen/teichoic acid export membrane protein